MEQLSFSDNERNIFKPLAAIVNVASVPQRSPFRYPGGKTWLVPHIRAWLKSLPTYPQHFIEPFAGGGIISLTVGFEHLAEHVTMVELDDNVAAVWKTILSDDAQWLADKIMQFRLTPETLEEILIIPPTDEKNRAFQTILKNRTNRGGILAPGAGKIKAGENGKGLLSRWYPATLRRRILEIAQVRERITFIHDDGLKIVRQYASDPYSTFFIDPPYTASAKRAGSRLYLHSEIEHGELFHIADTFAGDFLMTYDDAEEVHTLAHHHNFTTELVAMKSTHHIVKPELLIGRNLGWTQSYDKLKN